MPIRRSPNGARHVRPQPGRNRPERVVAINRNARSQSVGTGGRNHPVRAGLNMQRTNFRPGMSFTPLRSTSSVPRCFSARSSCLKNSSSADPA
jgi:hypothetical protein